MKRLLIICTLLAGSWAARAQDVENFSFRRVDKQTVPVLITGAAERDFSDGSITDYFAVPAKFTREDWMITSNKSSSDANPDYYSISVEKDGNTYYALYNKAGKRVATQLKVNDVPLPDNIVKEIHKKYPGYTIESNKYTRLTSESDKKSYFRITIRKDNSVRRVFYSESGKQAG